MLSLIWFLSQCLKVMAYSFLFFRAFTKKKGRNNVTVDELVHLITPKGRGEEPSKS